MAVPYLQLVAVRIEWHEVQGIAMSEASVVESPSVVVYRHGAERYLVLAVAIDISNAQVVVALSGIALPFGVVGVEDPS